jgi:hypothetical protein
MSSINYSAEPIQFNINGSDVLNLRSPGSVNASVVFNGTGAVTLPVGNNSTNRPSTPTPGMIRYQNTTNNLEFYNGTAWTAVGTGTAVVTQWKEPVRVATTGAGTLASSFQNGNVIDGVTLVTGDRILIKNQAAPAENGIYTVNATGAPTRATDMDIWDEVPGATVFVNVGTANADQFWFCTSNPGGTLGTTAITWSQISGSGTLQSSYNSSTAGEIVIDNVRNSVKIRDAAIPNPTDLFEVQNNVGNFDYLSVDTQGAKLQNGVAATPSLTFQSDPNTGIYRADTDTIGFATNGTEVARLTTAGLEIGRNATTAVTNGEDVGSWDFVGFDGTNYIPAARIFSQVDGAPGVADMPGRLILATTPDGNSTPIERMRISNGGAVAFPSIGTTASAANAFLDSSSTPANNLLRSTSSLRYKTEVESLLEVDANKILQLRPVTYKSNAPADDPARVHYGLIAEEVFEVDPRLIHFIPDAENNLIPDGVQYERLCVLLIDVVKQQQTAIEDLQTRVNALENLGN